MTFLTHKEIAEGFLKMATNGKVREAFDMFVAPNFQHHNQYFKGDVESLIDGMEEGYANFSNKKIDFQRVIEEEEFVVVHSKVHLGDKVPEMVLIHLFKFKNDKIVELWEASQPIIADSVNDKGAF